MSDHDCDRPNCFETGVYFCLDGPHQGKYLCIRCIEYYYKSKAISKLTEKPPVIAEPLPENVRELKKKNP